MRNKVESADPEPPGCGHSSAESARPRIGQWQVEERVRDAERRSRAWLDHSPVCTKIIDGDFNLQYMSEAGIRSVRIDDISKYYGKPYPFDFYPQDFCERMTCQLRRAKDERVVTTLEASITDLDGNELWFHSTIVPVCDESGDLDYLMVVSLDITARKQAEEERMQMERQVLHAQKLESLGMLSGGIAHDFNNILMSIQGNADLALEMLEPDSPCRRNMTEIQKAVQNAADLAGQMLAYSGRSRSATGPVDLQTIVHETRQLLQVTLSKSTTLHSRFERELPTFHGDATQVRQVIMNLIINAAEAIGDDAGRIDLTASVQDLSAADVVPLNDQTSSSIVPGCYVCLEVRDTGCGMEEGVKHRIFDPFFTTKMSGRGLGMSVVLGIVRGHGGAIAVDSHPGEGTTFRIAFPAGIAGRISAGSSAAGAAAGVEWSGQGTILVADDEELVCSVARQMLERLGFEVLTAVDGLDAVDVFARHAHRIDCAIVDLTMPGLNGRQVLQHMQQLRPEIPVVLCSGYDLNGSRTSEIDVGAAGFIQKPFSMATLRSTLQEVLAGDSVSTRCA